MPQQKPYGSWESPITSELLTSAGVSLSQLAFVDGSVYWTEGRPLEAGRTVVIRDGLDAIPPGFNARTRAHEYGEGSYIAHAACVFFSNFADQRLYRHDPGSPPRPITPEPPSKGSIRYADGRVTPDGKTLVCVRERHPPEGEAINELVALPSDGSAEPRVLAAGHDFYASPRLSPDGRRLVWLTWDHPNMPWDGTELWAADFDVANGVSNVVKVAGSSEESVVQPEWSPDGTIHYVSDCTGWWNLYSERGPLAAMEAEFGVPQWVFGRSRYGFLGDGRIACLYSRNGFDHVAILDTGSAALETLQLPYTSCSELRTDSVERVFIIAASAKVAASIIEYNVGRRSATVIKSSVNIPIDAEVLSNPEPIEFPSARGRKAYALYYPPHNRDHAGLPGEKPPLLVMSHGGPTSAAGSSMKLTLQYWTSRGFAVVDVNYGGSTGFGRTYRQSLYGLWGIVDVEDCIAAARYLAERGSVDPARMAIRGGSAGGYTTLCALVFHDVFAAGAGHYGVGDLEALARDTHKFESRYLDRLVGPYPEAKDIYRERSPVHFADRLSCPVILFQGLDDKVVPPSQAEAFVAALRAKGLPFEYVSFPEEGHGFRKAETIRRVAEAELAFYARVFGFG